MDISIRRLIILSTICYLLPGSRLHRERVQLVEANLIYISKANMKNRATFHVSYYRCSENHVLSLPL